MAKGYHKNQVRQEAVACLGKELVRRSGAGCELCGVHGERLTVVEVEPAPEIPDADHSIIVCNTCRDGISGIRLAPARYHFLENAVWSDIPAVQVTAVRLCRRLAGDGTQWAGEILDNLYLSPAVEEWLK
jgi:protein PhnA